MKSLAFGIAAIAALIATPALAVDMAVKMPVKAPPAPVAAPWRWTGFYIGVNAGGSIGRNATNNNFIIPGLGPLPESFTMSPAGFLGGGQIGYNWQFSPNWLFGVEGDFQGTSQKETAATGFDLLVTTQQQGWFATARARFGYTSGDWLWYATGGGAWGDIKQYFAVLFGPGGAAAGSLSNSSTNSGWTVGGGVETHLQGNWTAKAEYLYVDLGGGPSGSFVDSLGDTLTINNKIHAHIIRAGLNYNFFNESVAPIGMPALAASMPVKAPPTPVAALWRWTGLYIGVNAGGSIGRNTTNNNTVIPGSGSFPESYTVSPAGFVGGGQIGYNWQFSPNWLFGVEGDFQGTSQKETAATGSGALVTTQQQDWFATARARFGYTSGDWLWYATGGGAWGDIKQNFALVISPGVTVAGSVSNGSTNGGWTVGGGVETHLWGNWTAKAEYLYLDLGNSPSGSFVDALGDTLTITSKIHDHMVRAGVNYKFN